jgi:GT2 family glycosyltransferase/glycosyltransferase involved in cell wall biosynthesis
MRIFPSVFTKGSKADRRLADDIEILRKSPLLDPLWYRQTYPDLRDTAIDVARHYLEHGAREGRNPGPRFHTLYYRAKNSLDDANVNPLKHYYLNRSKLQLAIFPESEEELLELQKRTIRAHFDELFYRTKYHDHLATDIDALDHYLRIGWRIGFDPTPKFSTNAYLNINQQIHASNVNPFYHYLVINAPDRQVADELQGATRRAIEPSRITPTLPAHFDRETVVRTLLPEFDEQQYLRDNPDVRAAHIPPLRHYIDYGWREGRNPNGFFWTSYYLSKYEDVRASSVNPFFHYIEFGRKEGRKPNPIGSAFWKRPVAPSAAEWGQAVSAKDVPQARLDVIVPVYKGYADTLAAIYAVLANAQSTPFNLIVINDSSPDKELTIELRYLHERGLFSYFENKRNIGFVGTVNRGLDVHPELDVILLNSDAIVHGDWIDRLLAHADRDPSVATITPFSNNGTICSYPDPNGNNLLSLEMPPAELDECAKVSNKGRSTVVPTGVGFCFYMRRSIMNQIGKMDGELFRRGYGEENDYCMRALKAGFKNLFAHDVFVYHTGQVSFADFASIEYGSGQDALQRKHPDYKMRVHLYAKADPAREARMRLDLYRLARFLGRRTAVLVTHAIGGGVETHVRDLAKRLTQEKFKVLCVKVGTGGGDNLTLSPEPDPAIYMPSLGEISINKHYEMIRDFVRWLQPAILHVHSFAGLSWAATLKLMSIIKENAPDYYCTLHDFTALCHRHHLVTNQGQYCGTPPFETCRACINADADSNEFVDPAERRTAYGAFLEKAKQIYVPSKDTAARYESLFPAVAFHVRPHEELWPPALRANAPSDFAAPLRVAVIGAIGLHKGARVLHDLAFDAKQRSLPIAFTIIGTSSMMPELQGLGVPETGRYSRDVEAFDQLAELKPHIAFFPSIWPETYCYTLSLALAAGVPPVVFDIGAQAARLRELGTGYILDLSLADRPSALNDALLGLPLVELWRNRREVTAASYPRTVADYYGLTADSPSS